MISEINLLQNFYQTMTWFGWRFIERCLPDSCKQYLFKLKSITIRFGSKDIFEKQCFCSDSGK